MADAAHILVVDDDARIRRLVSRYLLKEGFRVSTAADGEEMQRALEEGGVEVVLLDLILPGEDDLVWHAPSTTASLTSRRAKMSSLCNDCRFPTEVVMRERHTLSEVGWPASVSHLLSLETRHDLGLQHESAWPRRATSSLLARNR